MHGFDPHPVDRTCRSGERLGQELAPEDDGPGTGKRLRPKSIRPTVSRSSISTSSVAAMELSPLGLETPLVEGRRAKL